MGEAKRRKKLDPNFGKGTSRAEKNAKTQVENLLPDYGHIYYSQCGDAPINLHVENPIILIGKSEAQIGFKAAGALGTIIVPIDFAKEVKENPSKLSQHQFRAAVEEKYKASSGEWVIPFVLA